MMKKADWPRWDALAIIERQSRQKGEGHVFPVHADTVGWAFEKACKLASVQGVCFHMLRHEALSRYAQVRKLDVLRLKKISGHRDVRNLQRYVNLDAETLAVE